MRRGGKQRRLVHHGGGVEGLPGCEGVVAKQKPRRWRLGKASHRGVRRTSQARMPRAPAHCWCCRSEINGRSHAPQTLGVQLLLNSERQGTELRVWTLSTLSPLDRALQPSDCFGFRMFSGFPVFARPGMQFESHLGHRVSAGQRRFFGLWPCGHCTHPARGVVMTGVSHAVFVGGRSCGRVLPPFPVVSEGLLLTPSLRGLGAAT
ncbi:hypothetical protein FBY31_0314 [Arthrobacter sp. SLBN-100]|nr:hypothetical protein FBY31_0314 [Arthrobacter sp. SLBN-100]